MRLKLSFCLALALLCLPLIASAQDGAPQPGQVDMAAMMAKARKLTQPGESHKLLERFIGTWDTESRITMAGMGGKPDKGVATVSWLFPGRWIRVEGKGSFMGNPMESFYILGYDNFKQSYVSVNVGTIDTAMLTAEGDLDPGGKALVSYGTLDEYLTGEHDKMVKYVWRFVSEDRLLLEVHDLPIGEKNTQVIEIAFNRKK